MGEGKYYADMLERMAQFELTLLDWAEGHKGARKYVAFADKCWPAFPEAVRLRAVLCELPPCLPRHSRGL